MTKSQRIVQVKIDQLTNEGLGSGELVTVSGEKSLVAVPFTMPGDEAWVSLEKKKKGVRQGKALEWLHLSEERTQPRCKHFGACGGCRMQHVPYERQLSLKEQSVKRYLQPYLHETTLWQPIIPSHKPYGYRNKMELSFSSDKAGNRYLGLILFGTRGHVFQMEECHLMNSWIVKAVEAVSAWWEASGLEAYHCFKNTGALRTLTLRNGEHTGDRMIVLTVSGNPDFALNSIQLKSFVSALREKIEISEEKLSIFLRIQQTVKGSPTQFYEMLLYGPDHIREILQIEEGAGNVHALNFRISPVAFFQPNSRGAETIYSKAIQMTPHVAGNIVYDLYCGTGTLGICMAKSARQVIGIELCPESVVDARENIKNNDMTNISIHEGDVGKLLPELLKNEQLKPSAIVVDPPRSGLDSSAIKHLIQANARVITYISCNPATQAANLEHLVAAGYQIRAVQPIDQFPHTKHVENIVSLERLRACPKSSIE